MAPIDKARQKENQQRHRDRNFHRLMEYLSDKACLDCGEADPIVLQFDHLPEFEKKFDIGRSITGSTRKWEKILEEMAKCEIVCANCHTRRTAKRSGWRKHLIAEGEFEHPEGLFDKATRHRVPHGGGVKGRRGCKCVPCVLKKKEYDKNWHKKPVSLEV